MAFHAGKKFTKKRFCGSLKGWYRPVCLFVCLFFPLVFPECLCSTSWLRSCLLKFANLELLAEGPSKELSFLTPETLHEQKNIQKKGINLKKKVTSTSKVAAIKQKRFPTPFLTTLDVLRCLTPHRGKNGCQGTVRWIGIPPMRGERKQRYPYWLHATQTSKSLGKMDLPANYWSCKLRWIKLDYTTILAWWWHYYPKSTSIKMAPQLAWKP